MSIDLNIPSLSYAESHWDSKRLMSNKLIKEIINEKTKSGVEYNCLHIPMLIFNIIETNHSFEPGENASLEMSSVWYVGSVYDLKCYVDLQLPSDRVILKQDKISIRDNKISHILDGENLQTELEIIVSNC